MKLYDLSRSLSPSWILVLTFFLVVTSGVSAQKKIYTSLSYAPQISNNILFDTSPVNRTIKNSPFGLGVSFSFFPWQRWGFSLEANWGILDSIKMKSGDTVIVSDSWEGSFHQFHFSLQTCYIPFSREHHQLILSAGPSLSLAFYSSEYGSEIDDYFIGLDINLKYRYLFDESFYFSTGLSLSVDFIYFGKFYGRYFEDFIQFQWMPEIGAGYRF